jgi:hypothetical protein
MWSKDLVSGTTLDEIEGKLVRISCEMESGIEIVGEDLKKL